MGPMIKDQAKIKINGGNAGLYRVADNINDQPIAFHYSETG